MGEIIEILKMEGENAEGRCSAARRILQTDGVALVASGTYGCIRSLYTIARELNRLEQFFFCYITPWEYGGGQQDSKIRACVQKALLTEGIRAVILYPSCMEVLTGWTQDGLEGELENPQGIPVYTLFPGPMVKRRISVMEELEKILKQIPSEWVGQKLCSGRMEFVPQRPDYSGILDILSYYDCQAYLLTPGGCASCTDSVLYTRICDVQLNGHLEYDISRAIGETAQNNKLCCILGTPPLYMAGVDFEEIVSLLGDMGIQGIYLGNTGFAPAVEGASKAMLKLGQMFAEKYSRGLGNLKSERVNLLEHDSALRERN